MTTTPGQCFRAVPHGPHVWNAAGPPAESRRSCPGLLPEGVRPPQEPTAASAGDVDPRGLLTPNEHQAVELAGRVACLLDAIAEDGPARAGDLAELCAAVHVIQNGVLAQAAARAYPDRYRLMGASPVQATAEAEPWNLERDGVTKPGLTGDSTADLDRLARWSRMPEYPCPQAAWQRQHSAHAWRPEWSATPVRCAGHPADAEERDDVVDAEVLEAERPQPPYLDLERGPAPDAFVVATPRGVLPLRCPSCNALEAMGGERPCPDLWHAAARDLDPDPIDWHDVCERASAVAEGAGAPADATLPEQVEWLAHRLHGPTLRIPNVAGDPYELTVANMTVDDYDLRQLAAALRRAAIDAQANGGTRVTVPAWALGRVADRAHGTTVLNVLVTETGDRTTPAGTLATLRGIDWEQWDRVQLDRRGVEHVLEQADDRELAAGDVFYHRPEGVHYTVVLTTEGEPTLRAAKVGEIGG